MELHAGTARISEDGVYPFAFQGGYEDFTAFHGFSKLAAGLSLFTGFTAHGCFGFAAVPGAIKRPTTVSSRGSLSKFILASTVTGGFGGYYRYYR
jgi:hypothetical protein